MSTPPVEVPVEAATRRRRWKWLLPPMAVLVTLVLVESGYRLKLYLHIGHTPLGVSVTYQAWNRSTTRFDRQFGLRYEPNSRAVGVRVTDGRPVLLLERSTDPRGNVGASGDGYDQAALKVVVVGDSFTENQRDGTTWPALLEDELASRIRGNVGVLNFARSGHGLLQMVDLAAEQAEQSGPDIVVVAFISDDLNRDRFWQTTRDLGGEPRLVTMLAPDARSGWPASAEIYDERIDMAWCRRVLDRPGDDDPLLAELTERFETRKRDNPLRIDYASLTSSFLYNRLVYKDPFFGQAGKAATPRFGWRDFGRDAAAVDSIGRLKRTDARLVLVQLPQVEELEAGRSLMTGQQRALRASLERLAGRSVIELQARAPAHPQPRSLFLLPHDHHPSRQGLAWLARAVADVLVNDRIVPSDDATEGRRDHDRPRSTEAPGKR